MNSKPEVHRPENAIATDRGGAVQSGPARQSGNKPFRIQRILVPIDFSECSRKALKYAVAFSRQFGASLTLVSAIQIAYTNIGGDGIDLASVQEDEEKGALDRLKALAKEEIDTGITFQTFVRSGQPTVEIIETAKEQDVDLIIISTHGYTGLKRVVLGSTTEKVVRHAPCPVLVVREHEHEFVAP